jgi:elongation factor Ts
MTQISASLVKELRDKTGAGMMDCKAALQENAGDVEASIDWLRKKGLSKAAKKADRVAADGLIGVIASGAQGAVVEVNSETDFVARNEQFQGMVTKITTLAPAAKGDLAKLLATQVPGVGTSVEEYVRNMVATIGENMNVRRTAEVSVADGVVAGYVHNKAAEGVGKIGVLVGVESKGDKDAVGTLARQLALHIAAAAPVAITIEDLDPVLIEKERAIYVEQAKAEPRNAGKSDEILAKASEGRLRKEFFQQVVLMQQVFLGAGGDGKQTVEQVVKAAEKTAGAPLKVAKFVRFALGEGVEKKEGDFAAEVAAMAAKR